MERETTEVIWSYCGFYLGSTLYMESRNFLITLFKLIFTVGKTFLVH